MVPRIASALLWHMLEQCTCIGRASPEDAHPDRFMFECYWRIGCARGQADETSPFLFDHDQKPNLRFGAVEPNPWMILPFVALLGAIALAPLIAPAWWSAHYPKVALGLGALTLIYYTASLDAYDRILHTGHEYVSFIALIGSLFMVSSGIQLSVKGEATPFENVRFLFVGAVLSNVLGTTGASMLLIRPWLKMNHYRITGHHIVFFIFIVANVGGCLTPIGDPPLFLGYLKGVPFWWVAKHCWAMWITGIAILLLVFFVIDQRNYLRAPKPVREKLAEPPDVFRFAGLANLFFLAAILGAVFIERPIFLREAVMILAAVASYFTTNRQIYQANHFNFHPIQEVAILFLGIFATMMPALDWLQGHAAKFSNHSTGAYYWGTGALSSVLDNAPTYLCFLSAAIGPVVNSEVITPVQSTQLIAISLGAVFFGACTYIGNGPNFLIKAIADQKGIHTPSFVAYVVRYTLPCMLPMLFLVWWIFLRK